MHSYILNRGWIDKTAQRLPTYKEITSSRKGKGKAGAGSDSEGSGSESDGAESRPSLEEDDFDEVAERFESSYNFRFEEPCVSPSYFFCRACILTIRLCSAVPLRYLGTHVRSPTWCADRTQRAKRRARKRRREKRRSCSRRRKR